MLSGPVATAASAWVSACRVAKAEIKTQRIHTLAGFGPPPGRHFFGFLSIALGFSLFFKSVPFSETIREFNAFCERARRPKLNPVRFFYPRGSCEEERVQLLQNQCGNTICAHVQDEILCR